MPRTALIVDDDAHIRDVIRFALEQSGLATREAADGTAALAAFDPATIDIVILDIGLPERDGLEVCREIRKRADTPILFLSARDEEIDRIIGLEIGGDDYVTKPFSPRELTARIKAILKRGPANAGRRTSDATDRPLAHADVVLDSARHRVTYRGAPIRLTATEFAILAAFLARPEHVRDRTALIEAAYDANIHVSDRTVDSHIRHIRAKFADLGCTSIIETIHGVGYKLGHCR